MDLDLEENLETEKNYITHLPPEILEQVFLREVIQETELCYLSQTCSLFRDVLLGNELWRSKFLQRWPALQIHLQNVAKENPLSWRSLYRERTLMRKAVRDKLKDLSHKTHHGQDKGLLVMEEGNFYDYGSLPIFSDMMEKECLDHEQKTTLIVSELMEIYHNGNKHQNLNAKYFAEKSLSYLRHLQLDVEIKTYCSMPIEERDVEVGAVFIAKWFQPTSTFSLSDIKQKFDHFASKVKATLFEMHSNHPIFHTNLEIARPTELKESLWNVHDCRLILSAIEQTLKPILKKDLNHVEQYFVADNSFINLVLETYRGIPITLSLFVAAVACRLGLVLEPVNFPRHFLLRWMERPTRTGIDRFTFVDVYNDDYSLTFSNLVENFSHSDPITVQNCDPCNSSDILQRMLRNLVALGRHSHQRGDMVLLHHACQLYIHFFPQDLHMNLLKIQIQIHLGINLPQAMDAIEELASAIPWMSARLTQLGSKCSHTIQQAKQCEESLEVKRRNDFPEVTFSVGMVMRHKKYRYICVIYGWDNKCKASREWINQMGVNRKQEKEPFYHVLVMDGTNRYACQENLQITLETCEITHPMIGLYFDSFNGRYYTPCESVQEQFPDDAQVTHHDVHEFFL